MKDNDEVTAQDVEQIVDEALADQARGIRYPQEVTPAIRDESGKKVGRNDPCPCGSNKKFKKCCWSFLNS